MSLKDAADSIRAQGRGKDTELVHLTKRETQALEGLARAGGGSLTRNPKTGLPEAGFLDSMLPTILGVAANFVVPGSGLVVGGLTGALQNKEDPLMGAAMGAMGGYGGGELAQGLQGIGAAAPEAAASAIQNPLLANAVNTGAGSQAAMLAAQNAGDTVGLAQLAQAAGGTAPTGAQLAGIGATQAAGAPMTFIDKMGGPMAAAKTTGMALAPAISDYMTPDAAGGDEDRWDAEGKKYDYKSGYTGGESTGPAPSSERRWFTPQYTQRYAYGGQVDMESGGFVIPADVVSMAGGGSTDAGLAALAQRVGARPLKGAGDGMSDDIPASIDGKPVARVANGEAYVPRDAVKKAGGARRLYKAMNNIRKQAHGKTKQQRPVNLDKALT